MRYYVRKTNRGKTPQKLMQSAAYAVMHQGQSLRAIAKALNICHATLFRFIKKLKSGDNPTVGYKPKLLFTASQEQEIVKQLAQYAKVFCGLSIDEVRKLSFHIARRWKYVIPESWIKNGTASKDWGDKFVRRHNFPVKPLKGKSMKNFFTILDKLMDKHKFLPSRIYYLEEITVPIAKYIADTSLADLKPVCMELAVNASGEIVTPMLMMNNEEYKLNDKSKLCIESKTEIRNATDSRYLNHFIDRTKPCVADPILLLIDNCQYVDMNVLKKAKQNSITLLCIPKSEGCMKTLVKLAKFVKKPSKSQNLFFEPGCDVSHIVCAMLPSKKEIVKCFRENGVWPFNPSVVTGEEFIPEPIEEYNFKVSAPVAQPLPGPSRIPTTQTSDANVSSKNQDPLSRGTIDQCRFCGEFTKCVPITNKPYISNNTTLAFNDVAVQLDFSDGTLPKTVCQACDAKLTEMYDFVKVVKAAQESLINVAEPRQLDVEIDPREDYETLVVKTEYDDDEKDEDDGNDESKDGIVDSLTIGETIFIKEKVTQKRKTKTAGPKTQKKAKVNEVKSENEHELIMDIKEEVIERDTNDLESDTGCFVSDTGTDAKPSEVELATSALVFEMRSDGSGYGYS